MGSSFFGRTLVLFAVLALFVSACGITGEDEPTNASAQIEEADPPTSVEASAVETAEDEAAEEEEVEEVAVAPTTTSTSTTSTTTSTTSTTSTTTSTTSSTTTTSTTTTTAAPTIVTTTVAPTTTTTTTTTTAAPTPTTVPPTTTTAAPVRAVTGDDEEAIEDDFADAAEAATDAVSAFDIGFGPGQAFFFDGDFARIEMTEDGIEFERSADGSDWQVVPTTGLPANGFVNSVVTSNGMIVATIDVFPEEYFDAPDFETEEEFIAFEEEFGSFVPESVLAVSANGSSWTTTEVPSVAVDEGGFTFVNGAALSGDRVAILVSREPVFVDPFQVLFESDLLTEEEAFEICDFQGEPGEPIAVFDCNFEEPDFEELDALFLEFEEAIEGAETDEERALIEEEFFAAEEAFFQGEEIFTVNPGDEIYDALSEALFTEPERIPSVVLTGPLDGPLQEVELPTLDYPNTIIGTNDGFMVSFHDYENGGVTVLRSVDGLTWTEVERFVPEAGADPFNQEVQIVGQGDLTFAFVLDFSGESQAPIVLTSDDLGDTWTESTIPTELFGVYTQSQATGPAGIATLLEGNVEDFVETDFPFPELDPVNVAQDGFVMTIDLDVGTTSLSTADGEVIYESISLDEAFGNGGIPGVLDINNAEDAVWLDPETGEELVVFLSADLEAAVDEAFAALDEQFEDQGFSPDVARELWFSADGETWILLESTTLNFETDEFTSIIAVGDDEILLETQTFLIPPPELFAFEEEGREPTEEEIAALNEFFASEPASTTRRVPVG